MNDRQTGLYNKFTVTRTDGKSKSGEKHHACEYFALDITHDLFAKDALRAYAAACKREYPALARDLLLKCGDQQPCGQAFAYFMEKKESNLNYAVKSIFDKHIKDGLFIDGPFRETFGDGYGEPHNPNRQAFGIIKVKNRIDGGEFTLGVYTNLGDNHE